MSVTNCNCPKKLECGCSLSFSSFVSPSLSVLSVGTLTASGCAITGYVIDWYRDGAWTMASASAPGMETGVSAIHPFTGSGAIPVMAGIYTPVVRYVVIAGQKVYTTKKACQKWCEMTQNLPAITVSALGCASGNPQSTGYQYTLSYLSSMDYALSSRLITVELNAGVAQFAWYFVGKTVADHIEIFHSRTGQVFADWIVGGELDFTDYTGFPHSAGWRTDRKGCFNLPAYQQGDALMVRISPNYLGSTYNTEWQFSYKCLATALVPFSGISKGLRAYDIDTLDFSYDGVNCYFLLKVRFGSVFPQVGTLYNTYTGLSQGAYNSFKDFGNGWYGISLYYSTSPVISYVTDNAKKSLGQQWVSVTKTGSDYAFLFSDALDYQAAKSNYAAMVASPAYTGWVNDPTDVRYYRIFFIRWGQTSTSCGDNELMSDYHFFIRCNVAFDDALRKMTITSVNMANGLPDSSDPCNRVKNDVGNYLYGVNYYCSLADFSQTSRCLYTGMFKCIIHFTGIKLGSSSSNGSGFVYQAQGVDNDPDGIVNQASGWCFTAGRSYYYANVEMRVFMWYLGISIQRDANGNWLGDPLQNFWVRENMFDPVTNCYAGERTIYQKVNGVVTVKRYYDGN